MEFSHLLFENPLLVAIGLLTILIVALIGVFKKNNNRQQN